MRPNPAPETFGPLEPGLMTRAEFIKALNPENKHHSSDTWDDTRVEALNRVFTANIEAPWRSEVSTQAQGPDLTYEYRVELGRHVLHIEGPRFVISFHKKGLKDPIGVLDTHGLYYAKDHLAGVQNAFLRWDEPLSELKDTLYESFKHSTQVKYPKDLLNAKLNTIIIEQNLDQYPLLLNSLKIGDHYFDVRAEARLKGAGSRKAALNTGSTLVILHRGKVVAAAQDEWGATLIRVAHEARGLGLGPLLRQYWTELNPEYTSGGFTSAGQHNAEKAWNNRVRDFLANGWYTQLINRGQITKERVQKILKEYKSKQSGKNREEQDPGRVEPMPLVYIADRATFMIYDKRALAIDNPEPEELEPLIYAYGFFRDDPKVGLFLYSIDYEPAFKEMAVSIALQMAKNMAEPIYLGPGYGADLDLDGIPDLNRRGDYVWLTRDIVSTAKLAYQEKLARNNDPYDQQIVTIQEQAEAKW